MNEVILRTGVWYDDRPLRLFFPETWDVRTYWPPTPAPLPTDEIKECLLAPSIGPSILQAAEGKQSPLIVVDDLARPTPAGKILPFLIDVLQAAGISRRKIRILVATGTHGHQDPIALSRKLGEEIADTCPILIHNDRARTTFMGHTSYGTPVFVNSAVTQSDLVIGIGGIYPQHTVGFGGGSKIALGILGRKSIVNLHFGKHGSMGGRYEYRNSFRADLDEIAQMIGLRHIITVHVDGNLEVVNIITGDPTVCYSEAAEFTLKHYRVPRPDEADVVIANTYPSDISYTFMRKGFKPLRLAPSEAIKIAIGSIPEGVGRHGIFKQVENPWLNQIKAIYFRMQTLTVPEILQKIAKNLRPRTGLAATASDPSQGGEEDSAAPMNIWLFRPGHGHAPLPCIDGVRPFNSWGQVLDAITATRGTEATLRVRIYPCASLLCIPD